MKKLSDLFLAFLLAAPTLAAAQALNPVAGTPSAPAWNTSGIRAYSTINGATTVVCVNPSTHVLESCSGSGGGGAITIASGADAVEGSSGDTAASHTILGDLDYLKAASVGPIPAGEAYIGHVGGTTNIVGASFTTTATTTALSDLQLLANSSTNTSVVPLTFTNVCRVNAGTGMVRRARIKISDTGLAGRVLLLNLYQNSPTVTNGDHATFLSSESNYIGQIPVTLGQHFNDPIEKGIGAPVTGSEINFDCASGSRNLYGLIESSGSSGTLQGSKLLTAVLEALVN